VQVRPDILRRYDAVLVADDDIVISARQLNRLFAVREAHDLWVLQPAFNPMGKVSWPITARQPGLLLRYTNFVEMTCPLFRTDKLIDVLGALDPELLGVGVDWFYHHWLGATERGRYAVVDAVSCINPTDRAKGRVREVLRVQSIEDQKRYWYEYRTRHAIQEWPHCEHGRVVASPLHRLTSAVPYRVTAAIRWVRRTLRRRRRAGATGSQDCA
jgi:hypothetical protein